MYDRLILPFLSTNDLFIQIHSLFGEYSDIVGFIFGLLEVFRRFVWNYFHLENEHLNNCGAFRDRSVRPLPSNLDLFGYEQSQRQEAENRRQSQSHSVEEGMVVPISERQRMQSIIAFN